MASDSWREKETGLVAAWKMEGRGERWGVQEPMKQEVSGYQGLEDETWPERRAGVRVWLSRYLATQAKGS